MSKLLVIFGATGQQGGSVANYVLKDPVLSKEFKIRAVTRNPSKPAAQALQKKGVEVIQGDLDDENSVKNAVQGAHTIVLITATVYDERLKAREFAECKNVADAAVATEAQYMIFSTLYRVSKVSGGKYKHAEHFDVKAEAEDYIRSLPIKSAFFVPGYFMQNFSTVSRPHPMGDGTYAISCNVSSQTRLPLIDAAEDSGKFIGAILADPKKFEGKQVTAASGIYTFDQVAELISKATGKSVKYNQLPLNVFQELLPPPVSAQMIDMMLYIEEFGYYGSKTQELVKEGAEGARGKLNTFEEFLTKNPIQLQ
ncbi:hypothetical protein BX616_008407 [Lobosporangium transversale]|uniref:NmrA family transcriptional regulator n=1 Tax=Lobosporangium transversale TaxID=64571 RepID=A0A1Y2GQ67_9FUNG|nr:NmrA family transcriptional regulator [Lobosporangium transversale]KAF9895982.1 hypothetical protein BX616_008407 [Lobosporangium transversale]ORZ14285.1 NmrA family transcriptional regulator [Lobosporangium transversale]|eukprot:XP_021880763.1 NmrA family transcriptional regulator [Lobosporangium transversale]